MTTFPPANGNSEKWYRVSTSGRTPSPRCGHTAVYVPEESMLIIFGGAAQSRADFRPSDNDVHVLSIDLKGKVMKWKTKKVTFGMKGTKPNVYAYHAAVSLSQSKIAVFGGFCCDENNKQREGTRICNDLLILYHLDQLLVPVKTFKRGKSTRQKDGSMFQIRRKNTTEDKKAKIKPVKKKKREGKKKTKDGGDDGIGLPYQVQHTIHVDQDFNWTGGESVFQIEEKLGEGAYGAVYKGRQKETGFILAIKEINDGGDFDDLKKEIEILKRCRNKHVVCYYGTTNAKNNNNNLWILMEYCSVGSVRDLIEMSELTLVEDQVAFICREALMGLVYLHAQKIIHRDVKAANILVDSAGTVKIADFGVSEQLSGEKSQERIGTPLWMAPEVMQNREYDSRCDIWSLGITAIEMADGLPPRHELSPARAMRLIPSQPPPTLENPAEWSDEFNAFVKRCLVKDPTNRPTAMDLLTDPFIVNAKGPEVLRERIVQVMKIRKAQRMKKLKEAKGEGEDEDDETNSSNTTTTSTTTSNHTSTQDSAFSTMVVVDGEQGECKLNEDFSIFSTVIVNAQELEEEGEAEGGDMWSTVRVRQVDEDEEDGSGSGDAFSTMVVRDDDEEEEDEDGGDAFSTMVVRKADDGGEDDEEDDDVGGDAFSTIVVRKKVVEEEADEDEEGGDAFSTMVVTRSNKTEEGGDDSAFDDAVRRKFLGQQQQIERRTEEEEETDFAEAVRRKFGMMGTSDNNEEDDQPPPLPPRTKGGRRRAEKMTAETIELLRPLVERYVAETVDAVLERKLQQELDALQKKASG
ncbi:hypothetical protein QOT17_003286 [Balamuthia mandrillaris]